jgi:hypothetical protein
VTLPDFLVEVECPHGAYYVKAPGIIACRCVICIRCRQHTGNSHQGHHWRLCRITRGFRNPHFCCPNDCELGADTSSSTTNT